MRPATLVLRSLRHFWRTNLAVVLGVATAVAVLAGALLVGEPGRTVRLTLHAVLPPPSLGEFSLQPRPQEVHAMFLPLRLLQQSLGQEERANTLLVAGQTGEGDLARELGRAARLDDLGLRLRILPGQGSLSLEGVSALLDDDVAAAARKAGSRAGFDVTGSLVYRANALRR